MRDKQAYDRKLRSIRHQLELTEKVLNTHPLLSDRLTVLQTVLRLFRSQTEWTEANSLGRFLITLNTALLGISTNESQTGLFGPQLTKLNEGLKLLLKGNLPFSNSQLPSLLTSFMNVMGIGLIFYLTQCLGNWKRLFPLEDIPKAKNAGLFLKELGLIFILGSRLLEAVVKALIEKLDVDPRERKNLEDIGMGYLLFLLILIDDSKDASENDFGELLLPFIGKTVDSLIASIQALEDRGLVDVTTTNSALSQLQLIKRATQELNIEELRSILISGCEVFGGSYVELKKEMKSLIEKCSQLSISLENALTEVKKPQTNVLQSA